MSERAPWAAMVLVTCGNEEEAIAIARNLVGEGLAACVNLVGPIRSIYRWRGKVEDDREVLLLIKTRLSLTKKIERRVRELHSYEVPEVIVLSIKDGSAAYIQWLLDSTMPTEARKGSGK